MPTLENFQGASLVPNVGGQLGRGLVLGGQLQQQRLLQQQFDAQQAQQARFQQLLGQPGAQRATQVITPPAGTGGGLSGLGGLPLGQVPQVQTPQPQTRSLPDMAQIALEFPERFIVLNESLGLNTQRKKDEASDFAFKARNAPPQQRAALIQQRAAELRSQGRDPSDTLQLLGLPPEQQNEALDAVQIASLPTDKRVELVQGPKPTTLQQNIQAAGFVPGTPEFSQEILRSIRKPTGTTVNIDTQKAKTEGLRLDNFRKAFEIEQAFQDVTRREKALETGQIQSEVALEGGVDQIQQTRDVVNDLLVHPGLPKAVGLRSALPTVPGSDAANFEANLDTLKSKQFLAGIQRLKEIGSGAGGLSDAEGSRFETSAASLALKQDRKQFKKNLNIMLGILDNAGNRLVKKHEPTIRKVNDLEKRGLKVIPQSQNIIEFDREGNRIK